MGERQRPRHVAGQREEQDQRLLGRAGDLPQLRRADVGHHRSGARLSRGRQRRRDQAAARDAGELVLADDEPPAARRRLRRRVLRLGQLRARPEPDARSDACHRAVRGRMRQQRRHRRPRLPLAGLQHQQHRIVRLEGQRLVRHRLPQHEGRLSGHVDGRQPRLDDQRHRAQTTASATASRTSSQMSLSPYQNDGYAGWHAALRAGAVDARHG